MADDQLRPPAALAPRHRGVPLRISQVFSACSFCKARKIKCDGIAPFCGGCVKHGRQSTCSLSQKDSGHDYPTYLQRRIETLQKELEAFGSTGEAAADGNDNGRPRSAETGNDMSGNDDAVDTLIADIGGLPVVSFASQPSPANDSMLSSLVMAAASVSKESSEAALITTQLSGSNQHSADQAAFSQPPLDVAERLAKHYFDHIYQRLPFFSIQGFWAQFAQVYPEAAGEPAVEDTPRSSLSHCRFTVFLVLAIAMSSHSRSADSAAASEAHRLFQGALEFQESALVPNNIIGVQSILFLIQFATLNPSTLDAWYLISVGLRMCLDLRLHQDPQPGEQAALAPSLLETRRRLWWSVYSVDRSMNLGLGRPPEVPDAVCKVSLPSFRIEKSSTETEILVYLQRYRVLLIQSKTQNRLNEVPRQDSPDVIAQLRGELVAWHEQNSSLPEGDVLESEWLMGLMLLNRPCRAVPQRTTEEMEELWRSAIGFNTIYRRLVGSNSIFYIRVACEKIYWTGLVLLLSYGKLHEVGSAAAPQPLDLWAAVKDALLSLQALSERWEEGKKLYQDFDALTTDFLAALQRGTSEVPPRVERALRLKKLM